MFALQLPICEKPGVRSAARPTLFFFSFFPPRLLFLSFLFLYDYLLIDLACTSIHPKSYMEHIMNSHSDTVCYLYMYIQQKVSNELNYRLHAFVRRCISGFERSGKRSGFWAIESLRIASILQSVHYQAAGISPFGKSQKIVIRDMMHRLLPLFPYLDSVVLGTCIKHGYL